MRAVVLRGLEDVALLTVPRPVPGPGQLLVRTAVSTVCTSDLHDIAANPFGATLPLTLGHEGAGTVAALGEGVDGFALGDRIVAHPVHPCGQCQPCRSGLAHLCANLAHFGLNMPGTLADYFVVSAERARHLPPQVPFAVGALFEPLCVCLHAIRRAAVTPGDPLLILGDGPFGLLMAHIAYHQGLTPVVLAGHQPFRLAQSPVPTVNTVGQDDPTDALCSALGGEAAAVILATDAKIAVNQALHTLRRRGRLVVFASLLENTPVDLLLVQGKELAILGACNDEDRVDDALALLETTHAALLPLITHLLPVEAIAQALTLAAEGQDQAIKVGLVFDPSALSTDSLTEKTEKETVPNEDR